MTAHNAKSSFRVQFSLRSLLLWMPVIAAMTLWLKWIGPPRWEILYGGLFTGAWLCALQKETVQAAYGWLALGWVYAMKLSIDYSIACFTNFHAAYADEIAADFRFCLSGELLVPAAFTLLVLGEAHRHQTRPMPWKKWFALGLAITLCDFAILYEFVPLLITHGIR